MRVRSSFRSLDGVGQNCHLLRPNHWAPRMLPQMALGQAILVATRGYLKAPAVSHSRHSARNCDYRDRTIGHIQNID